MAELFDNNDTDLEDLRDDESLSIENEFPIPDEPVELEVPVEVQQAPQESETPHLSSCVCDMCLELNLTTKTCIECIECGKAFCYHFASAIDPTYCVNCMSDMNVTKQTITKTYEHKDTQTGETKMYRRRAREIKIGGLSWLFAQRKIVELSDVELDMAIEYHRNICSLMIDESERRRNERMHRYANVKVHIPTPSTTKVEEGTSTTVKKVRTVSKNKQGEQLAALLASLTAKGMTIQDIANALKK